MAERTVQVTEQMADFIKWVYDKGEDAVRGIVREHLAKLKETAEATKDMRKRGEHVWDDAMEPNDGNDQWKHGGDCNLCRKVDYCMTKCRANKLLKKVTTPLLYQEYLDGNPDAAAKAAGGMAPEDLAKQLGALQ